MSARRNHQRLRDKLRRDETEERERPRKERESQQIMAYTMSPEYQERRMRENQIDAERQNELEKRRAKFYADQHKAFDSLIKQKNEARSQNSQLAFRMQSEVEGIIHEAKPGLAVNAHMISKIFRIDPKVGKLDSIALQH